MRLKGKDLIFITQIKRDGSGVEPVGQALIDIMQKDNFVVRMKKDKEDKE